LLHFCDARLRGRHGRHVQRWGCDT